MQPLRPLTSTGAPQAAHSDAAAAGHQMASSCILPTPRQTACRRTSGSADRQSRVVCWWRFCPASCRERITHTCTHHTKGVHSFVWCHAYSCFASCGLERDVTVWHVSRLPGTGPTCGPAAHALRSC
jgi:WD40 repeat protein